MAAKQITSIKQLANLAGELGVRIPAQEDVSILAEPVAFDGLTAPNALAVQPMEGCDGDSEGRPGPLTLRRYERFAAGGAGLVWLEATAVVPEGRANPRQLWLHRSNAAAFQDLVDRMRRAAAERFGTGFRQILVLQLTHSGRYCRPRAEARPLVAQGDPYRDQMAPEAVPQAKSCRAWPVVSDGYLDDLVLHYVDAARLAFEAGFDAVDIKSCHGYLVAELLSARDRKGLFGGSFENRTRFLLGVVDAVRSALGDKPLTVRLGVYDAVPYPYGWGVNRDDYRLPDLSEPEKLIAELQKRGICMINVTAGNPYYNPHVNRPFNKPVPGGYDAPEHPLAGVARMIDLAGCVKRTFPSVCVVGSGLTWLGKLLPNVAAAAKTEGVFDIAGAGRMAFAYPDFAADIIAAGALAANKVCISCSACTQLMRERKPTGCVVRDSDTYEPIHRAGHQTHAGRKPSAP